MKLQNITLYTTYYADSSAKRMEELKETLLSNVNNPAINKICLLNEGSDVSFINSEKALIIPITQRPKYIDFFNLINIQASINDLSIVANSDISFDKNIDVLNHLNFHQTCFALSRWNIQPKGVIKLFNRNDSQDIWIFKGKIRENLNCNFPLGIPRCDNRLLYELQQAGYTILNPSFSIKGYHLHSESPLDYPGDNQSGFVEGPYAYLFPHNLYNLPKTIVFNISHKAKLASYKYDLKKLNHWILVRITRKFLEKVFHYTMPLIGYKIINK